MGIKTTLTALLLLSNFGFTLAQLPSKSIDFGINGFYNSSPLSITLGGGAINGKSDIFKLEGNFGLFVLENAVAGIRYRRDYENFTVNAQFFNAATGNYDPYILIEETNLIGAFARYYSDLSPMFAAFAHIEAGTGNSLISVTEENDIGEIEQNEYPRDLEDFAVGLGLAFRPYPNVGIELFGLRRTKFESYIPQGASTTTLQLETYLGYEFRIGVRFNIDAFQIRKNIRDRKRSLPMGPGFSR
ncbi:MAG: hypothetical protein ACPGLV_10030 [Bacteroidia bacterium]